MELKALLNPDIVRVEACLCADSPSSSVVPEWERRNLASVRRWLRERVVQCILRGSRQEGVLWDWALQGWLRHRRLRVLVQLDVPARLASVQASAMFHAG